MNSREFIKKYIGHRFQYEGETYEVNSTFGHGREIKCEPISNQSKYEGWDWSRIFKIETLLSLPEFKENKTMCDNSCKVPNKSLIELLKENPNKIYTDGDFIYGLDDTGRIKWGHIPKRYTKDYNIQYKDFYSNLIGLTSTYTEWQEYKATLKELCWSEAIQNINCSVPVYDVDGNAVKEIVYPRDKNKKFYY